MTVTKKSFTKNDVTSDTDWDYVCQYEVLSEDFIREFASKLSWSNICLRQNISEEFVAEFADYVDWNAISCVGTFSKEFLTTHPRVPKQLVEVISKPIDLGLLNELEACEDGIDRFLQHTRPTEVIDWFTLRERHAPSSITDLSWLVSELRKVNTSTIESEGKQ